MVSTPSTCLWITMVDGIFFILSTYSFTFHPVLTRPSQKFKHCNQYVLGAALFRTWESPFVLNINFWSISSFFIEFTYLFSNIIIPLSNYLLWLPLLCRSLCLAFLSNNRLLNSSLCLNISGDEASNWSKDWFPSELPSIDLSVHTPTGNENSMLISTND